MNAHARMAEISATLKAAFAEAGDDMDISRVTVLAGSDSQKIRQLRDLNAEHDRLKAESPRQGDHSIRGVLGRAGALGGSPRARVSGGELGESIRQATADVRSGRASTAYVDPWTGKATDLVEHEREAAALQASWIDGGMYAGWTDAGVTGGMVPIEFRAPVFTLRASSVMLDLPGINIVAVNSDRARFPRISGVQADGSQLTQVGVTEGQSITETMADVDMIDVQPIKYGVFHVVSSEFMEDANSAALELLAGNAMKQLGLQVDLSMLQGLGASDLVGLRNIPGISTTSVAATPTSMDKFADTLYAARAANADPTVWIMNPRSWNTLSKVKTGLSGDNTTLLEPDPEIVASTFLGLPVRLSTQITLTEGAGAGSWVAAVDPPQLIITVRRPPLIEISPFPQFQSDNVVLKITARFGFAALNAPAVSIATDVR